MKKIANKDARQYVQNLTPFKGSNLYSENWGKYYVVFSYGYHYPMLVCDTKTSQWYSNSDRYSMTTSKQMGQATPFVENIIAKTTAQLKAMLYGS